MVMLVMITVIIIVIVIAWATMGASVLSWDVIGVPVRRRFELSRRGRVCKVRRLVRRWWDRIHVLWCGWIVRVWRRGILHHVHIQV